MNWMYSLLNSDVINTYSYVVSGSGVETPWWIYLLLILDRGFRIGVRKPSYEVCGESGGTHVPAPWSGIEPKKTVGKLR
ncbi:hypothetical protein EII17_04875 [Clostridiales bacterium COT073_COT-073]|nr:hypothetical protein EII17_04875 [Clostridiales bacterium COT073_COT-073]